jgi:hypothetical protein
MATQNDKAGEFPKEWQDVLDALYAKFASNPTQAQRIKILEVALGWTDGQYYIGSTSDWRDDPELVEWRKMKIMELDYLESLGLYKPWLSACA